MSLEYALVLRDGTSQQLTLEGAPADPESCFLLQTVQGLDGGDVRDNVLPLADRDGDYLGVPRSAGRTYSVEGLIVGVDRADMRTRERLLRAAVAVSGPTWSMRVDGRVGDPEPLIAAVRTSSPFRAADGAADSRRFKAFAFTLRSPDAVLYGIAERSQAILPVVGTGGFSFPFSFPLSFAGASSPGDLVVNDGTASTWPVLRIYGPITNPVVENLSSGERLVFATTVAAGTFLEVDSAARTITLGGDPTQRRYSSLNRSASSWWPLYPGANAIRLLASTSAAPARLEIRYRNAHL